MSKPGITPSASLALESLVKFPWLGKFYLAGGTALALQIAHRLSFDLDFFSLGEFDQKEVDKDLKTLSGYSLDRLEKNTLLGMIGETKISFFTYQYGLIAPVSSYSGVTLASLEDVAAMKVDAIGGRGTKRDFFDLYFLAKKFSLPQILDFYLKKYRTGADNLFHIIKSLNYFDDAENPPQELKMLIVVDWEEIKKFFNVEVKKLAQKYL